MNTYKPIVALVGATGQTARLILEHGRADFDFRLIARNPEKLRALATATGATSGWISVSALDTGTVARAVQGSAIVINAAGGFSTSAVSVARAAMRVGASYIDISNEFSAVSAVLELAGEAEAAHVALVPASGYGTVASEGLVAWLAQGEQIRTAEVALMPDNEGTTVGTRETVFDSIASGGARVVGGQFQRHALGRGSRRLRIPDTGSTTLLPVPLGDLASIPAGYGAEEVTASFGVDAPPFAVRAFLPALSLALRSSLVRSLLSSRRPPASAQDALEARSYLSRAWARVGLRGGETREGWMTAGEGYRFTADAVLEVARHIAGGRALPGSMTAIRRFGPQFLHSLPGVKLSITTGSPARAQG
ncbi:saccharopine dehydrogenase NADP-binding domain-containing protein [Galbitalea soli]|uniref:NAD(P)H-binding protein n=1 Tax=Galbitalea soli TaxID=1268042 RepID=A0A7C9TR88_9MICO|nr:saccharopine dehydrogenase NADP-binding domain-containing protein [Galbitalea soli]NEM92017.1 NAD(P)H-binding protein [Galbitalea soli]NYJ32031.1 short subunit dehydrogenase-like uncharacterized protein [Galbitalea soli]